MRDYEGLERLFIEKLSLERRPVAVAIRDSAPAGVPAFIGTEPAGCGFWRLAAGGQTFYTKPEDHYNCPIGSYTHNIPLPPDRQAQLDETVGLMTGIGYLSIEELPGIARLDRTPSTIVYAPLAKAPVDPDVVLVAGRPNSMMLLQEAALRAGAPAGPSLFARPTCMAIPAAMANGVVASNGCIGNRVYTEIGADEMYVVLPGRDVFRIAAEIETIAAANSKLADYHRSRLHQLRSD